MILIERIVQEPAKFKDNVNKVGILKVAEELHQVGVGHCLVKPAHKTHVRIGSKKTEPLKDLISWDIFSFW